MTGGTVTVLLVLWLGVLLPGAVRDWRRSPVATVDTFAETMARLSRVDGGSPGHGGRRAVVVPGTPGRRVVHPPRTVQRRLQQRRRGIVARLLALTAGTALLAVVVGGGVLWGLAGTCLATLVAYLTMLRLLARRAAEARRVVRHHPAAVARSPRPAALGPTEVVLPLGAPAPRERGPAQPLSAPLFATAD